MKQNGSCKLHSQTGALDGCLNDSGDRRKDIEAEPISRINDRKKEYCSVDSNYVLCF